jgi:hypothetical protein
MQSSWEDETNPPLPLVDTDNDSVSYGVTIPMAEPSRQPLNNNIDRPMSIPRWAE